MNINRTFAITLTENAVFEPECTAGPTDGYGDPTTVADLRDPFYASTSPQMYAIAAATIVSYLLVIILFITPRTFFVGGPGGGASFLGRRGMISGSYRSSSVVGVGGRPWLQKVAALTVAISLTIATVDTFDVAKVQYEFGYMDAGALTNEVVGGMEIRIVRVISSTFLWLAQVQTLIRLFPRHKEKVIIKWTGFGLIVLDTIFSILNNLVSQETRTSPRSFVDAVPALNYLFELALSLLYAAWVIFYSLSKHRYAFFHTKMKNICLVALLSLVAVVIPIVFFVLDISKPNIAGWGEYIRWVGAAAASVVVWEWVERIEALERDERNDGILGREVFDGDEMLEVTPSEEVDRADRRRNGRGGGGGGGIASGWGGIMGLGRRPLRARTTYQNGAREHQMDNMKDPTNGAPQNNRPNSPTLPPNAVTPVSRADTTSVASTVYCVRYHPINSPSPPILGTRQVEEDDYEKDDSEILTRQSSSSGSVINRAPVHNMDFSISAFKRDLPFLKLANPFNRRRGSPPQEVATAQAEEQAPVAEDEKQKPSQRWDLRSKFETLLPSHRGNDTRSAENTNGSNSALPITVIPARGGQQAWSPRGLEDGSTQGHSNRNSTRANGQTPVVVIPAKPRSSRAWSTLSVGYSQAPEADNVQSPGDPSHQVQPSMPDTSATQHHGGEDQFSSPIRSFGGMTPPVVNTRPEDYMGAGPSLSAGESIPEEHHPVPHNSVGSVSTSQRSHQLSSASERVHFRDDGTDIEAGHHLSR